MPYTIYVNGTFEDEKALVDNVTKDVVITGDEYHDKIDSLISGYLMALEDHGILEDACEIPAVEILPEDPLFQKLDFHEG